MSDQLLQLIPESADFQPELEAAEAAQALLEAFAPAGDASARFLDTVTFIHPATNWSGVECPKCSEYLEDWWGEEMTARSKTHFHDLQATTPCCQTALSLNDLDYVWPAGFARFVLQVMNPKMDLTTEQQRQLEIFLGTPLRKVWALI